MRTARTSGKGFCLFLGAGCSLSSAPGDISTNGILTAYLDDCRPGTDWSTRSPDERYREFVNSWLILGSKDRNDILGQYLPDDLTPSRGYVDLARLVAKGYVTAIITTNFDNLIDRALLGEGVAYRFYCGRGQPTNPTGRPPVVTLVKIHGGLNQCELAFSPDDLDQLPRDTARLVRELSGGPTLIVGYSGQDRGAMQALSSARDHAVFWATPTQPSRNDRATTDRIFSWLNKRVPKADPFLFGDELGRFDNLMSRLIRELDAGGVPPVGLSHFR